MLTSHARGGRRAARALLQAAAAALGPLQQAQPPQQACAQLEALGPQPCGVRSRTSLASGAQAPAALRRQQRHERAVDRALERLTGPAPADADAAGVHGLLPAAAAAATDAAAAAAAAPDATAAPLAPPPTGDASSAPVMSPLSTTGIMQQPQMAPPGDAPDSGAGQGKGWAPKWLSQLFDKPLRQRSRQQQQPPRTPSESSPLANAPPGDGAEAAPAQRSGGDGWEELTKLRDLGLDDYKRMIDNEPGNDEYEPPPRPRTPMRGRLAFANGGFTMDQARVRHRRYEQHVAIISSLEPDDKVRIKNDAAAMRDATFVAKLEQCTQHQRDVIRDVVDAYQKRKEWVQLLLEHRDEGHEMPAVADRVAQEKIVQQRRENKKKEKLQALLAGRDVAACRLKVAHAVLGASRGELMCPQTHLPFFSCCGARQARAPAFQRKSRRRRAVVL